MQWISLYKICSRKQLTESTLKKSLMGTRSGRGLDSFDKVNFIVFFNFFAVKDVLLSFCASLLNASSSPRFRMLYYHSNMSRKYLSNFLIVRILSARFLHHILMLGWTIKHAITDWFCTYTSFHLAEISVYVSVHEVIVVETHESHFSIKEWIIVWCVVQTSNRSIVRFVNIIVSNLV